MPQCSPPLRLLLMVVVLLGPGAALACDAGISSWTRRSPDGRFELSAKPLEGPQSHEFARFSFRPLRSGALPWTVAINGALRPQEVLLSRDGSEVLLIHRQLGQLGLYAAANGQPQGSWNFNGLLTASELRRIPTDECQEKVWVSEARVDERGFTLEIPVESPVGRAHEPRHILVQIGWNGLMVREPLALNRPLLDLIRAYRSDDAVPARLRLADELWGLCLADGPQGGAEIPRFWLDVLHDPQTPRAVLPIAVEGIGACGEETEVRSLLQLGPGDPERDAHILRVLARRLPEEAGNYALKVLQQPDAAPQLQALAYQHLLERGGSAEKLGRTLLERDADLKAPGVIPLLEREIEVSEDFWQVVPFCSEPIPRISARASQALVRMLRAPSREHEVLPLQAQSVAEMMHRGCPQALIMLGAMADRREDVKLAAQLYGVGLRGLDERPESEREGTGFLRLVTKVRLALLDQKVPCRQELLDLSKEVLADPARRTPVCVSSAPSSYGPDARPDCGKLPLRPAEAVARELLRDATRKGAHASED